tara:strand:- start:121 stop:462 length:342 start_codon:yes stop_codon:yes gene_type:complete
MADIIGLGIDIEEISRFQNKPKDSTFLKKIFTKNELEYCFKKKDPAQSLAARFCAKEAAIKASPVKLFYSQIEIVKKGDKPSILLKNSKFKHKIRISLSHCGNYATAVAIVYD